MLKSAIETLSNDQEISKQLVANAFKEASRRRASIFATSFYILINDFLKKNRIEN